MTRVANGSGAQVAKATGAAQVTCANDHPPVAPDWTCGSCGADWPCGPKRELLLTEYGPDRAMLSIYLGACLAAAAEDLRALGSTSLQDRFLGWLPRRPRRA